MLLAMACALAGIISCQKDVLHPGGQLRLASDGATAYAVVKPEKPTAADDYAVSALTNFLFQKTGAIFPVVSPDQVSLTNKYVFVGLNAPVLKIAGKDPLAPLKDQEYVARSAGADIFLYGKGMHGNLYAVVDFMENTLGRRWYTGRQIVETQQWKREPGWPVFAAERNQAVKPFNRKGSFSFAYRQPSGRGMFDFHLQNGMNIIGDKDHPAEDYSLKVMPVGCHSLFGYIPPSQKEQPWASTYGWIEKKDYFATNPGFFTMNAAGQRVVDQLCFSNPDLRKEFAKNVMEHIRLLKADGKSRLLLDVSAMDNTGELCFCPGCQELKKKYQTLGGPIFDYLFELCAVVKEKHPDTMIHTLAYRLSQTQKPPVMPAGAVFPDNLVVQFANVQDNADVDWNNPINRSSYDDLLAWGKLTKHLWTWYYPFNGMIDRMVTDIRLMKKAGVEGVFLEFSGENYNGAINFTELQIYIYNKLLQDVDRDVSALIREFTDYQYGPAAAMAWTYLNEMEKAWHASSANASLSAGKGYKRKLTGVEPSTVRRWQELFDRMENLTAKDERLHANIRRLRRGLDYRTLEEWNALNKASPEYFKDYRAVKERLGALPPWAVTWVADWEMQIKLAGVEKQLPAPFNAMDKALVRRFVPVRTRGNPTMLPDPDAAFGYGAVVNLPDMPFTFGFYQVDTKTHGPKCAIESSDIQPGIYRLYHLGEITVTPICNIWFSSRSWATNLQLGERLYSPPAPDNDNRYDVHVSLKFDKPIPPTPAEIAKNDKWSLDTNAPYSVLCDQMIFVKLPVKK